MTTVGFKGSRISLEHYFAWRVERSAPSVSRVEKYLPLKGKKILEVGCGYGAMSSVLLERGANVWATEIDEKKLTFAKEKLKDSKRFQSYAVRGEKLPFSDRMFDGVIIFDVIEHVGDPGETIREVKRVLKPGGYLYVEFTPYYSVTGHHLYDYAKWPIHILPEEKIKDIVYAKKVKGFMDADYYWAQFKSLNKLRIGEFQNMVKGFKVLEERFIIKYPEVFELNLPFLNYLGFFKDYFTMSFEGLYRMKETS